ncbi:DUF6299 family protein [Streptomyces sp. NPDC089919]|uniref:DUF6299 family protein n=1 Tax=Streptomyces sp. NPDC089919 TaxID=3155188 RepID=UPI00343C16D7
MRTTGFALAALAALAAFTAPAAADSFAGDISVRDEVHVSHDGKVTLSGTYRCHTASPERAVFVSASLEQDGSQIGMSGADAICDGARHDWSSSGSTRPLGTDLGFHEGDATVVARLMTLEPGGLAPMPRSLVRHEETVRLAFDRIR